MALATSKLRGPLPLSRLGHTASRDRTRIASLERGEAEHEAKLKRAGALVNPWRVAAEVFIFLMLFSWGLTTATMYYQSKMRCTSATTTLVSPERGQDALVAISSSDGHVPHTLRWLVDGDGKLEMGEPSQAASASVALPAHAFHIEWRGLEYFCLRHASQMRLVEVVLTPPDTHTLRLGRRSCDHPTQHFEYHRHSLWNRGARSYINLREGRQLRAHGDTPPWRPLTRETWASRMGFMTLPEPLLHAFLARSIELVSSLDNTTAR